MPFLKDRMPATRYPLLNACNRAFRKYRLIRHTYASIHHSPALEQLANTYLSDQSGTCYHLLESRRPERYSALPFMQSARSPCPVPIR